MLQTAPAPTVTAPAPPPAAQPSWAAVVGQPPSAEQAAQAAPPAAEDVGGQPPTSPQRPKRALPVERTPERPSAGWQFAPPGAELPLPRASPPEKCQFIGTELASGGWAVQRHGRRGARRGDGEPCHLRQPTFGADPAV